MIPSKTKVNIGDRLRGKVSRISSNKIFLEFQQGYRGIIRQREMSWDKKDANPYEMVKEGEEVDAIVLLIDSERNNLELSMRYAVHDPWKISLQEAKPDDVVEGTVEGVREYGAFVEITEGVTGFLPVSDIRLDGNIEKAHEALWVGDKVRAAIQKIDTDKRQLQISIKKYLASQPFSSSYDHGSHTLREFLDASTLQVMKQIMGDISDETDLPEPDRIQRVLIVDDNKEFCASMGQLLKEWGYVVLEAEGLSAARDLIEKQPVDVTFLDLSLSDGSAIEFAVELKNRFPYTHTLLLSGIDAVDVQVEEAQKNDLPLEYKPFGARPLAEYLIKLEKDGGGLPTKKDVFHPRPAQLQEESLAGYIDSDIQQVVHDIVSKSNAKGGALFQRTPGKKGEIEWLYLDQVEMQNEEAHTLLFYSPVEDVIREQKDLIIDNIYDNPAQSKYLVKAIPFISCAGFSIQVPSNPQTSAFFLFSDTPKAFTKQALSDSERLTLESFLFRRMVFGALLSTHNEVLRSQLRAGALHDVNNSLGSVDFKLSRLAERMTELIEDYSRETAAQSSLLVNEIQTITAQMQKTLELFRKLGRINTAEETDINSIVRRGVDHQKALASHLNVELSLSLDHNMPSMILNPTHLQQTIENIMLNAIQWSAGRRTHQVEVSTKYEPDDLKRPIKVRVADTGPGIHQQLQTEKIYELGYSTRENGSGLGLFIAKALVHAMGGDIEIEKSIMEVGTTMCIELPLPH
jgi:signal transduction histidine kinase/predicted RNA-binding protein with RPS1 domain